MLSFIQVPDRKGRGWLWVDKTFSFSVFAVTELRKITEDIKFNFHTLEQVCDTQEYRVEVVFNIAQRPA